MNQNEVEIRMKIAANHSFGMRNIDGVLKAAVKSILNEIRGALHSCYMSGICDYTNIIWNDVSVPPEDEDDDFMVLTEEGDMFYCIYHFGEWQTEAKVARWATIRDLKPRGGLDKKLKSKK